jgi:hypothetical protein
MDVESFLGYLNIEQKSRDMYDIDYEYEYDDEEEDDEEEE